MKAILIDVKAQTVTEVDVEKSNGTVLDRWYELIGCDLVTTGAYINQHDDAIMVDDEGLLNLDNDSKFFTFEGAPQPYAGNGLIVGINAEGDSVSPKVNVDEVREKVRFWNMRQIRALTDLGLV